MFSPASGGVAGDEESEELCELAGELLRSDPDKKWMSEKILSVNNSVHCASQRNI